MKGESFEFLWQETALQFKSGQKTFEAVYCVIDYRQYMETLSFFILWICFVIDFGSNWNITQMIFCFLLWCHITKQLPSLCVTDQDLTEFKEGVKLMITLRGLGGCGHSWTILIFLKRRTLCKDIGNWLNFIGNK